MLPKVSVVIPVYNTARYLRECLDSIVNQTIKEIEIICVNDGSQDNCLEILNEYAGQDKRFIIINQKNQGVGKARNVGTSRATGKYLIYLDSDDFFEKDMLECMYNMAEKDNSDRVICSFCHYDERTHKDALIIYPNVPENIVSPFKSGEVVDGLFNITVGAVWIELYRRDFLQSNNIRFNSWSYTEDLAFVFSAALCAKQTSFTNKVFVHYRFWNEKQTTFALNQEKKMNGLLNTFTELYNILIAKGLYEKYERAYMSSLTTFVQFELDNGGWSEDTKNELLSCLPKSVAQSQLLQFEKAEKFFKDNLK